MTKITWTVEKRKVKDLIPLEKNPRKITKASMAKLKDRIIKRGMHDVVKLDTKGIVLSGNMRTQALTELGVDEVDVMIPSRELTGEERGAIILESNKSDGEWDQTLLPDYGTDVLIEAGFETMEVDQLMHDDEDEEDPFDAEKALEKLKTPRTKLGDMFKLGDSYLLCGDSVSEKDVEKLMQGQKADMVFTDPPYNMNFTNTKNEGIMNDNMGEEQFILFCEKFMTRFKESVKLGGVFYICSGFQSYIPFLYAMRAVGIHFAGPIIWVKNTLGMGMNDYRHKHEMIIKAKKEKPTKKTKALTILYGWNNGKHYFADTHEEADVWNISRPANNVMQHPTQKPIALVNRAIKNSSKRDDIILDLFAGSGSTLISAIKTGRRAYCMELDPKFCDVIINRYENITGDQAEKM